MASFFRSNSSLVRFFCRIISIVLFFNIFLSKTLPESKWNSVFVEHLDEFLDGHKYANYEKVLEALIEADAFKSSLLSEQIINWRAFQDLSILNGDEFSPDASLIRVLPNCPKTMLGKIQLANTMAVPLCEEQDLLKRKSFIDCFFAPENSIAHKAIELFVANHDQCLEFLFREHAKDDQSCLNPKHGFYCDPVAKREGVLKRLTNVMLKFLKLDKFGITISSVSSPKFFKALKLDKIGSMTRFLGSSLVSSVVPTSKKFDRAAFDKNKRILAINLVLRFLYISFFVFEDFQSTIVMLHNIFNIKPLKFLVDKFAYTRRPTPGSPFGGSAESKGWFMEYPYLEHLQQCKEGFWDKGVMEIINNKGLSWKWFILPIAGGELFSKGFKPVRAILRLIWLINGIYNDATLAFNLYNVMAKDLKLFLPLVETFFQLSDHLKNCVGKDLLQIDSQFMEQFAQLTQSKQLFELHKEILGFNLSFLNFPMGLKIYKMLYLARHDLMRLMSFYGQLEVFLCAYQMSKNPNFVRPEFVKSDCPYLKVDQMWSLPLGFDESVKNSFEMGAVLSDISFGQNDMQSNSVFNTRRFANAVITGANAGGKSFFIREVLTSVLLAQSLLVCPCASLKLTPFSKLYSFIKKEDDPANKLSLHWCECAEVGRFNKEVELFPRDKFVLAILDELFSGTAQGQAGVLFENFIGWANQQPNLIGFYTTHATKALEERGFFDKLSARFYKFGVNRGDFGQFLSYKYLLEGGIATSADDTALDVARMAGIKIA